MGHELRKPPCKQLQREAYSKLQGSNHSLRACWSLDNITKSLRLSSQLLRHLLSVLVRYIDSASESLLSFLPLFFYLDRVGLSSHWWVFLHTYSIILSIRVSNSSSLVLYFQHQNSYPIKQFCIWSTFFLAFMTQTFHLFLNINFM